MPDQVRRILRRPGVLPALVTALGVLGYLVVADFVTSLLSGNRFGVDELGASAISTLTRSLPFAVGVFLSFWQIAPIAAPLRLAHVVTRALLASVIAAGLSFVVSAVASIWPLLLVGDLVRAFGGTIVGHLSISGILLISFAPLVVLGAVFLWGWLQRHPLDYVPRGTLDEV